MKSDIFDSELLSSTMSPFLSSVSLELLPTGVSFLGLLFDGSTLGGRFLSLDPWLPPIVYPNESVSSVYSESLITTDSSLVFREDIDSKLWISWGFIYLSNIR